MNSYFRRYYEAPDDSGAALEEPTVEPDETTPAEDGPDVEPEVYTREQLAEFLPHFDRFATHEGAEALRQYGTAYDNSRRLISQGGHLTRQEEDAYRAAGIDPSEVQVPEPEADPGPSLFGVPWGEPQSWDEVDALAQSDHPEHKQRAAMAVVRAPDAPEEYKRAYWDNAYGQGSYDAAVMQQQVAREQSEELKRQLRDEILAEIAPVQQAHMNTYVDGMLAQARASIPGFQDHEAGIAQIMQERERRFPGYQKNFDSSDVASQVAELQELTLIAASRTQPQRAAAQQAAADATDAQKVRGRTESTRTNGTPDDTAALKQQSLDEAKRVFGQVR